jgi:hypothetical protein
VIRRWAILLVAWGASAWLGWSAPLEIYELLNGSKLEGEPISFDGRGLVVRKPDGTIAERVGWTNFTQAALKQLATNPKARPYVEPLIEEEVEDTPRMAAPELQLKPVPRLDRPDPNAGFGSMFASGLSVTVFFVLYLANLYAGYEISRYRKYPPAQVCGVAAVAPVIGPIIFLSLPTRVVTPADEAEPAYAPPPEAVHYTPGVGAAAAAVPDTGVAEAPAPEQAPAGAPATPAPLPPPTIYKRGQFTFNRRFFETKLAGFLRLVPSEAERDMVIVINSTRGHHVGQRLSKIQPNDLCLQVNKGGASSEVIVPYTDILEVQVRHKDTIA